VENQGTFTEMLKKKLRKKLEVSKMEKISAFVLIKTKTGTIDKVIQGLTRMIDEDPSMNIQYADSTTGEFDIVTLIHADMMKTIYNFVVGALQAIEGITSTLTEVVAYDVDFMEERDEQENVKCYMMMTVDVGKVDKVLRALAELEDSTAQILKVACTTGHHDVIMRLEARDISSLYSFISKKVHSIEGITNTMTHIVAKEII